MHNLNIARGDDITVYWNKWERKFRCTVLNIDVDTQMMLVVSAGGTTLLSPSEIELLANHTTLALIRTIHKLTLI